MSALFPSPPVGYDLRLPRQPEAEALVCVGKDSLGRYAFLAPTAATAWLKLSEAAAEDGVPLALISGFRSVARQRQIVHAKLLKGLALEVVLQINAYPGFSEHHTGLAVDLGAPGMEPLTELFENTPQFAWLSRRASEFEFKLSYPKNHSSGISYEPWHWRFAG